MTFKHLISKFNQEQKAYSVLFELSRKVTNIEDYIKLRDEEIDVNVEEFDRLVKSKTPIERIRGIVHFWNRKFILNPEVFCPRYETEQIVQEILKETDIKGNYIDLCSGSGVIGISVALERPELSTTLLDIDSKSVDNIKANLNKYKLNLRVVQEDWFEYLSKNKGIYKIISANFPYIGDKDQIDLEILENEPKLALFSGCKDGWKHYHRLLNWLEEDKSWELVVLECNSNHEELWGLIINQKSKNCSNKWNISLLKDEVGLLRIAKITRNLF